MIIAGYYGIGKTSCADRNDGFVDLDSSYLYGYKEWEKPYCQYAEDISRQGKTVFVQSERKVLERLNENDVMETVIIIVPSLSLKEEWSERISGHSNVCFEDDMKFIRNMVSDESSHIRHCYEIVSMNYSLDDFLYLMNRDSYYLDRYLQLLDTSVPSVHGISSIIR